MIARLKRSYGSAYEMAGAEQGPGTAAGDKKDGSKPGLLTAVTKLKLWLLRNGLDVEPHDFLMAAAIIYSAVFIASLFSKNAIIIFLTVSAAITIIFFIFTGTRARKLVSKKEAQMETFLIDLTGNLYANPNIVQCIQKTMQDTEYPLKADFEAVVDQTRRGVILNDALENMIAANSSRIIRFIISGLIAANKKGVDLISFLKDQVDYLREKKSITNYIRILSSGPRYSSYVIMLIPIVVLGAVSFLNRGFAQNLISPPGLWVLIYSAISFTAGFLIINKIVNLTEGPNK
jgi:tight adherence protein B